MYVCMHVYVIMPVSIIWFFINFQVQLFVSSSFSFFLIIIIFFFPSFSSICKTPPPSLPNTMDFVQITLPPLYEPKMVYSYVFRVSDPLCPGLKV